MKVLHIIPTLRVGGAEKLLIDTLEEMLRQGVECELIVLTNEQSFFRERLSRMNITVHYSSCKSVYDPRNILFIRSVVRQHEYDCIHTHLFSAQLFMAIVNAMSLKKLPLITTEHSTNNRRRENRLFYFFDSWMYKQYDQIIAITEGTRETLVRYLGKTEKKTVVIYNGLPLTDFQHAASVEQTWNPIENEVIILMVAGMRAEKDHKTLIRASHLLPENYRIVFVGDGELMHETMEYAEEHGRKSIVFLGARSDVPSIMKASDIFVLSSNWEGFGLVVVEAAAAGLPIVASDIVGLREVVNDVNGLLFEQGNEFDLSEKIMQVTPEISCATSDDLEKYSITNMVSSYLELYNRIIQSTGKE